MRTIKLVIIGDSGVGKTSLRNQYTNGHFSTGYRATIGTDFITKTLPHYQNQEESVTLQIWDTAGQERFSSLSTAFFRGADAVLLMFDVNRPETMSSLMKWWQSFKIHAPVSDEEAEDFCCVVVGNKIDQTDGVEGQGEQSNGTTHKRVFEAEAERFLEELVPRTSIPEIEDDCEHDNEDMDDGDTFIIKTDADHDRQSTGLFMRPISGFSLHPLTSRPESEDAASNDDSHNQAATSPPRARSQSISIQPSNGSAYPFRRIQKSRSSDTPTSVLGGTMTTTRTSQTIYHTPSSSIFDNFESAPSSPFYSVYSLKSSPSSGPVEVYDHYRPEPHSPRRASTSSTSSSSALTITPSLFSRAQASGQTSAAPTPPTPIESSSSISSFQFGSSSDTTTTGRRRRSKTRGVPLPPRPERRPRLFFTSAKTGEGVSPVFEHITERVCMNWTYAEALEARAAAVGHNSGAEGPTTLRLGHSNGTAESGLTKLRERLKGGSSCCGS